MTSGTSGDVRRAAQLGRWTSRQIVFSQTPKKFSPGSRSEDTNDSKVELRFFLLSKVALRGALPKPAAQLHVRSTGPCPLSRTPPGLHAEREPPALNSSICRSTERMSTSPEVESAWEWPISLLLETTAVSDLETILLFKTKK